MVVLNLVGLYTIAGAFDLELPSFMSCSLIMSGKTETGDTS